MEERYVDAKTYIDAALKNRDSTENNSTVLEHAGDIYAMNGMVNEAVGYWKQALDDDHQTEILKWKIENKQYISEEEFQRKKNPAAAELKKSKVAGKFAGKKNKKGKKK